jgi:hypothetical protein
MKKISSMRMSECQGLSMRGLEGLGGVRASGEKCTRMSKLAGLKQVRAGKGKAFGTLMPKDGLQMSKRKGLDSVKRGR